MLIQTIESANKMFGFIFRLIIFYFLLKFILRSLAFLGAYFNRANARQKNNRKTKRPQKNDNFGSSNIIDAEFEDVE